MEKDSDNVALKKLFSEARNGNGFEYILTLLRVGGLSNESDVLLETYNDLSSGNLVKISEKLIFEILHLLFNLLNQVAGRPYHAFPFFNKEATGKMRHLNLKETVDLVAHIAHEGGRNEIADTISEIVSHDFLDALTNSPPNAPENINSFLLAFLNLYFEERLKFKYGERWYKMPHFEVLELLTDDAIGLCGFNMYFSNQSKATYTRTENRTEVINVEISSVPVGFFVGDLDRLKPEWMVDQKRLYEIGLPGRYNKWGEWKPIIYPGDWSGIADECRRLAKGDPDVEGVLFYIICTGHRVIEFVVRTPIVFPVKEFVFEPSMFFHMCEPINDSTHAANDWVIYDAHYELDNVDYDSIKSAMTTINIGLNRMAFAYDSTVEWRLKYSTVIRHAPMKPTPTEEDLKVLNSLLVEFPSSDDAIILDIAIDWFHRGELLRSQNVFMAYLSYYIALESVAVAVTDGDAELGLGYHKATKSERKATKIQQIKELHDAVYPHDPEEFIRRAYFDFITGLKQRTRQVVELVFGKEHAYILSLFEKKDGKDSLSDLRGKLAHGGVTLLSKEHQEMIRERLDELANIVKEFIKKIIIKPNQVFPQWSGKFMVSMFPSDPRDTRAATTDQQIFDVQDWKIRLEWFD